MKIPEPGIHDTVSRTTQRDTCVVLPSFDHALHYWPLLIDCAKTRHGADWITTTHTAIVFKRTHTALRLWVPYWNEPTMPMDFEPWRRKYQLVNLYGLYRGRYA